MFGIIGEIMTYKGSWQRPKEITEEQFSNNWDAIFGKKEKTNGLPMQEQNSNEQMDGGSKEQNN